MKTKPAKLRTEEDETPEPIVQRKETAASKKNTKKKNRKNGKVNRKKKAHVNKPEVNSDHSDEHEGTESEGSSSNDEIEVIEGQSTKRVRLNNLNFSKESLHFAKDHKVCFIDPKGNPLDEGSKLMFNKTKIENVGQYDVGDISEVIVNNKRHFFLILANNESNILKVTKLEILLNKLKDRLINNKILTFSLAKSKDVAFIPWPEMLGCIYIEAI